MNAFDWTTIALILAELGIGLTVLISNPRRTTNQSFSLISCFTGAWMIGLLCTFHSVTAEDAATRIRVCTVLGSFFPVGFNLIRLAITHPDVSLFRLMLRHRIWFWLYCTICFLSFTDYYIQSVAMPLPGSAFAIPEPVYGPAFYVWALYYSVGIITAIVLYGRDIGRSKDRMRTDLQFVFWGVLFSVCATVLIDVVVPILRDDSKSVRLAPFCAVGLQTLVAYGIASRKMLDVSILLRRWVAYGLVAAALTGLYAVVWGAVMFLLRLLDARNLFLPSLLAALAVAFAMAPARTLLQRIISKIIGNIHGLDPTDILPKADALLRSVNTTSAVVARFGEFAARCTGAEYLGIYLLQERRYVPAWESGATKGQQPLPTSSALIQMLMADRQPIYLPSFVPRNIESIRRSAHSELTARGGALALGIFHEKNLLGVVILGPRLSGRIYDESQQTTLQLMVNLLGVALENASLYTQIEASKVYVETLIDQLLSGVLVADDDGKITVLNRECARILQTDKSLLGQTINALPETLRLAIIQTQATEKPLRDQTTVLHESSDAPIPVRYGCHSFNTSGYAAKGTFIILDDMTQVKRLEEQLRRFDRLSSLGTLSASVAHEIKNPLTAIKTFAHLLPENREDADFLCDFTRIVEDEVLRIDNIVNQLLSFSRTNTNRLGPVGLHVVIENTLKLLHHDLLRRRIEYSQHLHAKCDVIWADRQKIEQILLNLMLNAGEAMPKGGKIEVRTGIKSYGGSRRVVLQVDDTGHGIDPKIQERIFDPFFTTKEVGTGLGLSIVYGIVTEYGGTIEALRRPEGGTRFEVIWPAYVEEAVLV